MYPVLSSYIESAMADMESIPQPRKDKLEGMASFVRDRFKSNAAANFTFICTHNSRRSHLSQIWAAVAAHYYGKEKGFYSFSGGTEATAFNPRAVSAIERAGCRVVNTSGENPHYQVHFSENTPSLECFSKKFDDSSNPSENFAAIMTCTDADEACPFIPGASLRVSLPYNDPKEADGTEEEAAKYDERCKQIATEMFYFMSQV